MNKNFSSIQGDMNMWKEQEHHVEKEMYNAEESLPTSNSTPTIDLVTASTTKPRELPPVNKIEEIPNFPP